MSMSRSHRPSTSWNFSGTGGVSIMPCEGWLSDLSFFPVRSQPSPMWHTRLCDRCLAQCYEMPIAEANVRELSRYRKPL